MLEDPARERAGVHALFEFARAVVACVESPDVLQVWIDRREHDRRNEVPALDKPGISPNLDQIFRRRTEALAER